MKCKFRINGPKSEDKRVPHVTNISIENLNGNEVVNAISDHVCLSTGAACHSGGSISYVLKAMNIPDSFARGTFRISLGRGITEDEIAYACKILSEEINKRQ